MQNYLLVEPIAKTPYPPLGLLKISSMIKSQEKDITVYSQIGTEVPNTLKNINKIFITSLFTWDYQHLINTIRFYQKNYPTAEIQVGGISATLLSDKIYAETGILPHAGILYEAEKYSPDYSLDFGRKLKTSISFTTRGCLRSCKFCSVSTLEPKFMYEDSWEKDIDIKLPYITFWDNNFLASPNFVEDCDKISKYNKLVDFNQGLDARLLNEESARTLFTINVDPIRFAFDTIGQEKSIVDAIKLTKKYSKKPICVYVLYNFEDTPEDFYYRINLLNKEGVLAFPMEYRSINTTIRKFPNKHWNSYLLRALKMSLLFYYRKGTITLKRESFTSIYGNNEKEFIDKLYKIYNYDRELRKK